MRISDWSSDVALPISDRCRRHGLHGGDQPPRSAPRRRDPWRPHRVGDGRRRRESGVQGPSRRAGDGSAAYATIGRASCRERVCKYVMISVEAVTLKKKTQIYDKTRNKPKKHKK